MVIPEPVATKLAARRRLPIPAMRRAIRISAGLTQTDVADVLGVHRESVTRWELGTRTPRGEVLHRYVELLEELRAP